MAKKQPTGDEPKPRPKRTRKASPKKASRPGHPAEEADPDESIEVGFSALAGTRGVELTEVVHDPADEGESLCDRVLDDLLANGPATVKQVADRAGIVGSAVKACLRGLISEGKVDEPVGTAYDANRCYRALVDLDKHGPSTPGDVARRTPIAEADVRTCLDGWVAKGEVESLGNDRYGRKKP